MSDWSFLPPELRYTRMECKNDDQFKKKATIKSDTWKIPKISAVILNESFINDTEKLRVQMINKNLAYIHQKCEIDNITKRANSSWILDEYMKVYSKLNFSI